MSHSADILFQPVTIGDLKLKNRIAMAPLTRNRADHVTNAPSALAVEYYRQRAGAGLIISEASPISQQGQGYIWTPGIYTDAQIAGWRAVTDAVHGAGGHMAIQLWHVGRVSHTSLQPGGQAPVSASAIAAKTKTFIETGFADTSTPRALELHEIPGIVADFAQGAANAMKAGFDAVELHGANGYLLDQFLRDSANKRTDAYGGPIENRARLMLEAVEAVLKTVPKGRVGIRLSPVTPANDISDSNPEATFGYVVEKLSRMGLAFIHLIEGQTGGGRDFAPFDYGRLRKMFSGATMLNNGYTRDMAAEALGSGAADMVSFGRPFIANPDLVERFRRNAPLNTPVRETFYGGGAEGYTDYPALG